MGSSHHLILNPAVEVKIPNPLINKSLRLNTSEVSGRDAEVKTCRGCRLLVLPQDSNLRVLGSDRVAVKEEHKFCHCWLNRIAGGGGDVNGRRAKGRRTTSGPKAIPTAMTAGICRVLSPGSPLTKS